MCLHARVEGVAKLGPALEAEGEDLGPELQVVDLDLVHLGHVHVVAVGIQRVGVISLAQEARRASLADDVALLQRPGQHHERQHRHRSAAGAG